ncbi:MAG: hypothetical protein K6F09_06955 [Clostridiales bacterium]|nr:hypothetical protein [Clostridiales bacterium]
MKRSAALIFALIIAFSLTSCGKQGDAAASSKTEKAIVPDTVDEEKILSLDNADLVSSAKWYLDGEEGDGTVSLLFEERKEEPDAAVSSGSNLRGWYIVDGFQNYFEWRKDGKHIKFSVKHNVGTDEVKLKTTDFDLVLTDPFTLYDLYSRKDFSRGNYKKITEAIVKKPFVVKIKDKEDAAENGTAKYTFTADLKYTYTFVSSSGDEADNVKYTGTWKMTTPEFIDLKKDGKKDDDIVFLEVSYNEDHLPVTLNDSYNDFKQTSKK